MTKNYARGAGTRTASASTPEPKKETPTPKRAEAKVYNIYCYAERAGNHGIVVDGKNFALFHTTTSQGEAAMKAAELRASGRRVIVK